MDKRRLLNLIKCFYKNLKIYVAAIFLEKKKILATISLAWIIIVGYLIWWNGLNNSTGDKSFRWDEWIWFGVVPAIVPYLFYFIWKKEEKNKE